jgi:probable RNA-binding protein EIF1AD
MPRPKRLIESTANETLNPPATLKDGWVICRVEKAEGKNLYTVKDPKGAVLLVELPARFRSTIWVKRGSFVVVDIAAFEGRENKLNGEIQNVIGGEKVWRKMPYW